MNLRNERILDTGKEAIDRTMLRTRFERGYGPVVRQIAVRNREKEKHIITFFQLECP
jgi:hypothetical protein